MIQKILEKLGINELNMMQQEAVNAILRTDRDVLVLSPTGTGKTLAYLLPLAELIDAKSDALQAVVVVPGRELALQSATVLKDMGSGLRTMSLYGGRPTMDEHRQLREVKPQIVFATPGRLNDHLDKGNLDGWGVRFLVIDEFDKCLQMGFLGEMSALAGKLPRVERRILLSATNAAEIPRFLNMGRTERVEFLDEEEQVSTRVHIYYVRSEQKDKLEALQRLLLTLGQQSSIVFLNYRDSVERTDGFLRECGFYTSAFHGGMEQKQREDALYKFSNGSANVMVSTDLASRGLDIPDIENIIHYHLPESEEGYIHRVGRTARWDKGGRAFFILGPDEEIPSYVDAEVEAFQPNPDDDKPAEPRMATVYIGKGKKDKISKGDIVGFLCKKGGLLSSEIGRIDVKDRYAYAAVSRDKLRQVLKNTQGEKIKGIKTLCEVVK
ncbi:MAG: DEAD/DEAH box helicase [Prevotella sp.]|nr:DEAD/DEAH box helicase [Prevotella sp.]